MSTTVHLPPRLLESVDHRARDLGVSRNRYIIKALEQAVKTETCWSPRFVETLAEARCDDEGRETLEEMTAAIAASRSRSRSRSRKAPPTL